MASNEFAPFGRRGKKTWSSAEEYFNEFNKYLEKFSKLYSAETARKLWFNREEHAAGLSQEKKRDVMKRLEREYSILKSRTKAIQKQLIQSELRKTNRMKQGKRRHIRH